MLIKSVKKASAKDLLVFIADDAELSAQAHFSPDEAKYLRLQHQLDNKTVLLPRGDNTIIVVFLDAEANMPLHNLREACRQAGAECCGQVNRLKAKNVALRNFSKIPDGAILFAEGMALANYQFLKYRTGEVKERKTLETINIPVTEAPKVATDEMNALVQAVYHTRNLVNEPPAELTAKSMSEAFKKMAKTAGFKIKVFDKAKIKSEKMGGLLAVNIGSIEPPTFSIFEWKPKNAVNEHPIILVGKGVTYDTGGLSLKATAGSMDMMKCDMAGAAAVAGAFYALASNKLPVYVVGLIPASDNRPGGNAYVPGDVITMHSGSTVEVLNTDAEGRMLLADALSYAKRYKPELVIDIATLTGSSLAAFGYFAMMLAGTADKEVKNKFVESGFNVYERLIELPLFEEYRDLLQSDIADLKNVGGKYAGAITASKFLEHFTAYPWMHIDATMAWLHRNQGYRSKNGSGVGVRLFYDFLKQRINQADDAI